MRRDSNKGKLRAARPERREEPKRRPEKPMDPNSPFAILETLKAQMMGKKN